MNGYIDMTPLARDEMLLKNFMKGKVGMLRVYGVYRRPGKKDPCGGALYEGPNFDEAMKVYGRGGCEKPRFLDGDRHECAGSDFPGRLSKAPYVPEAVMDEWYKKQYRIETVGEWLRFKDFGLI